MKVLGFARGQAAKTWLAWRTLTSTRACWNLVALARFNLALFSGPKGLRPYWHGSLIRCQAKLHPYRPVQFGFAVSRKKTSSFIDELAVESFALRKLLIQKVPSGLATLADVCRKTEVTAPASEPITADRAPIHAVFICCKKSY